MFLWHIWQQSAPYPLSDVTTAQADCNFVLFIELLIFPGIKFP